MWIATRRGQRSQQTSVAEIGRITLSGQATGVYLDGERRGATVMAPRGYHWAPVPGEEALVLNCGEACTPCMLGMQNRSTASGKLGVGEVWISIKPESGIHLKSNGTIELVGPVYVNGKLLQIEQKPGV